MRRFPEHAAAFEALRVTLVAFVAVMLMNALGLASATLADRWMEGGPPTLRDVLPGQLALLFGTWGLFSLMGASITRGVVAEADGRAAVLRGTISALEAMLRRFALPLIGFGTVFGVAGEGALLLLLGAELLFVWALLRVQLARHRQARAEAPRPRPPH